VSLYSNSLFGKCGAGYFMLVADGPAIGEQHASRDDSMRNFI